jgi:Mn2+/Fe2+ NRAMP family transporter
MPINEDRQARKQRAKDNADEIWDTGMRLVGKVVKILFVLFLLYVGFWVVLIAGLASMDKPTGAVSQCAERVNGTCVTGH